MELAICRTIAYKLWDLQGHALYLEVYERAKGNFALLFEDANEIEAVIKGLVQNEIVRLETIYTWYGGGERWHLRPEKVLRLRNDIELEIHEIISKEFGAAMKKAFAPVYSKSEEG